MQTNKEYWQKRITNSQRQAHKNVNKPLQKLYKDAYKRIDEQLKEVWLEMLESGEISQTSLYKTKRFRMLQDEIGGILQGLGLKNIDLLQSNLLDNYINEWEHLNGELGIKKEFTFINEHSAKQIINQNYKGATFSDRIWDNLSSIRGQILTTVTDSAILGVDVRKASKALSARMGVSYNDAKRITITETSRVFNEACRQSASETGLFSTYHILSEPNCCEDCEGLDGRTYELSESVLPMHPYCKCTIIIDLP